MTNTTNTPKHLVNIMGKQNDRFLASERLAERREAIRRATAIAQSKARHPSSQGK